MNKTPKQRDFFKFLSPHLSPKQSMNCQDQQLPDSVPLPISPETSTKKRYETLVTTKAKFLKNGKGAWYWKFLEPVLIFSETTKSPESVKLKCSLCNSTFSASNPSRTSIEHLKKGACPNFPSSSIVNSDDTDNAIKKRYVTPAQVSSVPISDNNLVLSGGKEDLAALAKLEASVKRLKCSKMKPGPPLSETQADAAMSLLAEWVFESFGTVSLASLDSPRFKEFLNQVGLTDFNVRQVVSKVLDAKYKEVVFKTDTNIKDVDVFQLCSSGWKNSNVGNVDYKLVIFSLNLPNGNTMFYKALIVEASAPSEYAEEIICDVIGNISGSVSDRCVGIVSDRFKSKALVNISNKFPWMINLSCQVKAIDNLVKDFSQELPLFETVVANSFRVASYFNNNSQARSIFQKYQKQELEFTRLFRVPMHIEDAMTNFTLVFSTVEDLMQSIELLQLAVHDKDYKIICNQDQEAIELLKTILDMRFWNQIGAVHSVVKLIIELTSEMEVERPLVGQCLPIWNDLRIKLHNWCNKFSLDINVVDRVIEKRFRKNYHAVWSLAFVLDPFNFIVNARGKYIPPFDLLTEEQKIDMEMLINTFVSREEACLALAELTKWRVEGVDSTNAGEVVQLKQQSRRLVWETCLGELKMLKKVAFKYIFNHATATCASCLDANVLKWVSGCKGASVAIERAQKMASIAVHAKFERKEFGKEENDVMLLEDEAI